MATGYSKGWIASNVSASCSTLAGGWGNGDRRLSRTNSRRSRAWDWCLRSSGVGGDRCRCSIGDGELEEGAIAVIFAWGREYSGREFSHFEAIHANYDFDIQKLVPVHNHPTAQVPYQKLVGFERAGETTFKDFINNQVIEVDIKQTLDGSDVKPRDTSPAKSPHESNAISVFCSYSHKDETYREQLEAHITLLKREGKISFWHDLRISLGNEWDPEIHRNLNSANIILLLISADFIASDYCYDTEVTRAMERHRNNEAKVIPIFVRRCDYETAPFAKIQGIHFETPIAELPNSDAAWTEVAKKLREAIAQMQQP